MDSNDVEPMELATQVEAPPLDGLAQAELELRRALKKPAASLTREQHAVLSLLLQRRNVLYVDRTGAGKSASYFLATKLLRSSTPQLGPTLILSPLLALMNDQRRKASDFGLRAVTFNSSIGRMEQERVLSAVEDNEADIVFITPEMLAGPRFRNRFHQLNREYEEDEEDTWTRIALIVIDEVHCVSDWGHDFRPDYFKGMFELSKLAWFRTCQKIATSATVNLRVERDIHSGLGGNWASVRGSLFRPNMAIRIITANSWNSRISWLREFFYHVASPQNWNVLLFMNTTKMTESVAKTLCEIGINAQAYHAGISNREAVEMDFVNGQIKVICSTIALGMGFDKDDIHAVIHFYTPSSPIAYYQEIGRAGRNLPVCRTYIMPDKGSPFRTDGQVFSAMEKVVSFVSRSPSKTMTLQNVYDMLSTRSNNFKKPIQDAAVMTAQKRRYVEEEGGSLKLLRPISKEDIDEFRVFSAERGREAAFMKSLLEDKYPQCVWKGLLNVLGQETPDSFRCEKCSVCRPGKDGDPIAKLTKDREICYQALTEGGITVYGLGLTDDTITSQEVRFRKILSQYVPAVGLNPPDWSMTYVPNSKDDANKEVWKVLCQEFELPHFEFLQVVGSKGVTGVHNKSLRESILKGKFRFVENDLPSQRNVIIYDDALNSGSTIDFVSARLKEHGYVVVAIVDRIWKQLAEKLTLS